MDAIERAGYTGKVKIGMDVAASEFYSGQIFLTIYKLMKKFTDENFRCTSTTTIYCFNFNFNF